MMCLLRVPSHLKLVLTGLLALFAMRLLGQPTATNFSTRFAPITPFPALAAASQSNQISLAGIGTLVPNSELQPGDSVTALIAFFEKGARQTQWLLHLQVVPPVDTEKTNNSPPPMVIHTTTGAKLEFLSSPAYVNLRTLGPFSEPGAKRKPPKSLDQVERVTLNEGFLKLGLDKASAVILRLNEASPAQKEGLFSFAGKPFSETEIKAGRERAQTLQLTDDELRSLAGAGPALMSYFSIVQRTAGLEDILFKLLDLPSLWSILRRGGVSANFRMESKQIAPADPADWGLPASERLYHLPLVLELNNQLALNITLAVTSPQSPLLACGGIVGLLAERPDEKERFLTLRIVSARRSGTNPESGITR
jgi:hypothetical protein